MNLERAISSVVELIVRCLDPDLIYLFGSAARNRAWPDSDIDLLVVARFHEPQARRGVEVRGLIRAGAIPVDLHLRTPSEFARDCEQRHSLAHTAACYGRLLYDREAGADSRAG